ncbi:DoxX family membrane protein [Actinopolymorpha cephalotaxi]|uniref:Thiosulfate dehydrogenase [quinone] large subunit n=1 Tax=Actinopolymorpha cephalotaxi TaxID=504797 RepID=A0ABX2S3F6_9ACTN|nr:DoxX family membrane protein [Actinopolymorpha cephalotaxi]NYH84129.1 thiosulfate dehydrogenase [quinone] large subunit [Actinopolymorpha cephalotaxi]
MPGAPSAWTGRILAVLRIGLGFVFLWAFTDKLFGWNYATPPARSWLNGGSPTRGFLGGVQAGPFQSVFHSWAGAGWADWLFMLGLLGVGVAVVAGVGLRLAAVAGSVMMVLMWAAEWPMAHLSSAGTPTMSTNPFVDYHLLYALLLVLFAVANAGAVWGLGGAWAKVGLVDRNRWLS